MLILNKDQIPIYLTYPTVFYSKEMKSVKLPSFVVMAASCIESDKFDIYYENTIFDGCRASIIIPIAFKHHDIVVKVTKNFVSKDNGSLVSSNYGKEHKFSINQVCLVDNWSPPTLAVIRLADGTRLDGLSDCLEPLCSLSISDQSTTTICSDCKGKGQIFLFSSVSQCKKCNGSGTL